jgi:hypothetical protein
LLKIVVVENIFYSHLAVTNILSKLHTTSL